MSVMGVSRGRGLAVRALRKSSSRAGGAAPQPGLQLRTAFLIHSNLASAGRLILGLVLEALGQLPGSSCLSGLQGLEAQAPEG